MLRPKPMDKEIKFDGGTMITETDLQGKITYVNRKFSHMSGYTKYELIGKPHSIVRHPDMPKCCFKNMWESLKKGETWKGYVKNLRKDGAFYWVLVYVSPKLDDNGETIGYIAARKVPDPKTLDEMKARYDQLLCSECEDQEASIEFIGNLILEETA